MELTVSQKSESIASSQFTPVGSYPSSTSDVPTLPDEKHIELVRSTCKVILEQSLTVGSHVYRQLFMRCPDAEVLFSRFNPNTQARAFIFMLTFVVDRLDEDPDELVNILTKLGKRHQVYGIKEQHYEAMLAALLDLLPDTLGYVNPELHLAWNSVWNFMTGIMLKPCKTKSPTNTPSPSPSFSPMELIRKGADVILPDFEGYLFKKSKRLSNWARVWIQLQGCLLFYFNTKGEPPKAVIDLSAGKCQLTDYPHRSFAFTIISSIKSLTLAATGDIEKDTWWEKLQSVMIEKVNPVVQSPTILFSGEDLPELNWTDFIIIKLIGRGSYGKVVKVRHKKSGKVYALKAIKKASLISLSKYDDLDLNVERDVLCKVNHPYVIHLHYAFTTDSRLCLVLDFLSGGPLLWHMNNRRKNVSQGMEEEHVCFYGAEISLALEYLHSMGIIYRDLKPENVLLDKDGHAVLTDFGLATTRGFGTLVCGSAPFMAPEILQKKKYNCSVDWWSLGVLIYEMYTSRRLFTGSTEEIVDKILNRPLTLPEYMSYSCRLLIRRMLERNPELRVTCSEIRAHVFFHDIDWDSLSQRKLKAPFVPEEWGSDTKYFTPVQDNSCIFKTNSRPSVEVEAPCIQDVLAKFPHNKEVVVLPESEYGTPIISRNGQIKLPVSKSKSFGSLSSLSFEQLPIQTNNKPHQLGGAAYRLALSLIRSTYESK